MALRTHRFAVAKKMIGLCVIALILAAIAGVFAIGQPSSTRHLSITTPTDTFTSTLTTTAANPASTATTDDPTNGLEVRLYLNASSSSSRAEANVSIFADVYDPSSSTLNVTSANDWVVPLNWTNGAPCGDSGETVGFAMAAGYYTSSNITAAKLLDLVNTSAMYMCPLYFGYGSPTGDIFLPMSDSGSSYGCIGVSPCLTGWNATASYSNPLTVSGYYQGDTFVSFPPGTYTVLAEDEWGALVLAYFEIQGTSSSSGGANTMVAIVTQTTTVTMQASQPTTTYAILASCPPTEAPTETITTTVTTTYGASSTTTVTVTKTSTTYTQTSTITSCTYIMPTVTSTVTTTTTATPG